jgi:hypothetical protein
MTGKNRREASMRIKPDGTLDEIWREPSASRPIKTPQQEYDELLEQILRTNPKLTRAKANAKAKEILDTLDRRFGGPFRY